MSDSLVIIPTYNEIENVEAIIKAVFALHKKFHVLIVDDNSPDGTSEKVRELQNTFGDSLFLETRIEKSGLGTAYIHGFKWAIDRSMIIFLRWMPIFPITPKTYKDFIVLVPMGPMYR